ncbi:MAG: hypothetical protein DMG39_27210 [Acidobacteria bacterium]|nr:MAG: hypothetical protein DMG39_27210 [Acidobacteriota bacterium]
MEWYREEYRREPDYSDLLGTLAKSPEDRNAILRKYFEPTDEERTRGIKMPMPAHKAVAELVSAGYVRVIVTTNFDRLLEQALQERGVESTVISTADQAQGALPLVHTNCTLVKVNGDYHYTKIKNTAAELGSYDERINSLLDRVFDEYGLIVCGWSATWDIALCAALERCRSHRFTTFWCKCGNLEDVASRVANFRLAEPIEIKDADTFFQDLTAKVAAIEQFDKPHPLSPKLGSAMVKRYLVDERERIALHDFVAAETEKVCAQLTGEKFPAMTPPTNEEFVKRIHRYEGFTEILVAIITTGCFWGQNSQQLLWAKSLERVANAKDLWTGISLWVDLRLYPALLLLYAGGLGAVASGKYATLAALLVKPRYKGAEGESSLIHKLNWLSVIESNPNAPNLLLPNDGRKHHFPMNEYLHRCLRPTLREFVPSDSDYDEAFDRFEYMFAMVWVDEKPKTASAGWVPLGRFVRNYSVLSSVLHHGQPVGKIIDAEVEREGENWPPLRAGLFGGSMERFRTAKQHVDSFIGGRSQYLY